MSDTDFFRARLDAMMDLRHPLAVLATHMPWDQIEASVAPFFKCTHRMERFSPVTDLFFGTTAQVAGVGVSSAGRPRLPIRLMVSLLYLKHAYEQKTEDMPGKCHLSNRVRWVIRQSDAGD